MDNMNWLRKLRSIACQRLVLSVIVALAAFSLTETSGLAQNVTATLSGTVQDATGAVIPGATIVLVNEATNDSRTATSTAAGFFAFPAILPGSYTLKISAKGFNSKNVSGITLHAGDSLTVPDLSLAVGA